MTGKHYRLPFHNIASHSRMQAFKDCGYKSFFKKSMDIFSKIDDGEVCELNETMFSNNLQNVWTSTVDEVMRAFGIKGFSREPRIVGMINSLVENRNAVAHGRETAAAVGERHSVEHLRTLHAVTSQTAAEIVEEFQSYVDAMGFLKPYFKKRYFLDAGVEFKNTPAAGEPPDCPL